MLGGAIAGQYVGTATYSVVVPGLLGLAAAEAAASAARPPRDRMLLALALAYTAIGVLLSFRFANTPYGPTGRWAPPLAAGLAAAALAGWPRRTPRRAEPG